MPGCQVYLDRKDPAVAVLPHAAAMALLVACQSSTLDYKSVGFTSLTAAAAAAAAAEQQLLPALPAPAVPHSGPEPPLLLPSPARAVPLPLPACLPGAC